MPSNHLVLCHPLFLLPLVFLSIRVFSSESALCIRWPKYWSFSFIISPSSEYSGLISFRIDWLDLSAVQGTLKSLFQHHSLVQFSSSVISDSLQPHGLQHARPPCPSPSPRAYTHVHWVGYAIQPSHPLLSPSLPAFNLSQHLGLFQWVGSLHSGG